ncbi:hypothetical protein D3C80_2012530 [compost metagenome]
MLAGPGSLNGCIKRQQLGLVSELPDSSKRPFNLCCIALEQAGHIQCLIRRFSDGLHLPVHL